MKKLIVSIMLVVFVDMSHSFASDKSGTITNITIQPTLNNPTTPSFTGFIFVTLSDGTRFYVDPTDITYESQLSSLLTAKTKGSTIIVGKADGSPSGVSISWCGNTYSQIYYLTLL